MPYKMAVLVDGAFISKCLKRLLKHGEYPQVSHYINISKACVKQDSEELFRIYFYDALPFEGTRIKPLINAEINFKNQYSTYRTELLRNLAESDLVAMRKGIVTFGGWTLTESAFKMLIEKLPASLRHEDIIPVFHQKCVDMKIGLDVAWLSSKRIVDGIILIANDQDFIPAMKHARREGVKVVIMEWLAARYKALPALREHADEIRPLPDNCYL